jgi:hypothetical protein
LRSQNQSSQPELRSQIFSNPLKNNSNPLKSSQNLNLKGFEFFLRGFEWNLRSQHLSSQPESRSQIFSNHFKNHSNLLSSSQNLNLTRFFKSKRTSTRFKTVQPIPSNYNDTDPTWAPTPTKQRSQPPARAPPIPPEHHAPGSATVANGHGPRPGWLKCLNPPEHHLPRGTPPNHHGSTTGGKLRRSRPGWPGFPYELSRPILSWLRGGIGVWNCVIALKIMPKPAVNGPKPAQVQQASRVRLSPLRCGINCTCASRALFLFLHLPPSLHPVRHLPNNTATSKHVASVLMKWRLCNVATDSDTPRSPPMPPSASPTGEPWENHEREPRESYEGSAGAHILRRPRPVRTERGRTSLTTPSIIQGGLGVYI